MALPSEQLMLLQLEAVTSLYFLRNGKMPHNY